MRTTVELRDEAYRAVKTFAREREESMGKEGLHGLAVPTCWTRMS